MTQNNFPETQLVDASWFNGTKQESAKVWNEASNRPEWKIADTAEYTRFLEAMNAHNTAVLQRSPSATVASIRKSAFDDMDLDEFNGELFG